MFGLTLTLNLRVPQSENFSQNQISETPSIDSTGTHIGTIVYANRPTLQNG